MSKRRKNKKKQARKLQKKRREDNAKERSYIKSLGHPEADPRSVMRIRSSIAGDNDHALSFCNQALSEASHLTYMTSSTRLQRDAVNSLVCVVNVFQHFKKRARHGEGDDPPNYWLAVQCLAHALCHVIEMWLLLKKERAIDAWHHKVDAEQYLQICHRALEGLPENVREHYVAAVSELHRRVLRYDSTVFPLMKFCSAGMSYKSASCSICGSDIEICSHIEGLIYSGRVCCMIDVQGLEMNHVALVENPKDRHCILTTIPWDDVERDSMTHEIIRKQDNESSGKQFGAIMVGRHTLLPDICT